MSATGWAWAALVLCPAGLVLASGARTWMQISSTEPARPRPDQLAYEPDRWMRSARVATG
jgi:hypothetical protein